MSPSNRDPPPVRACIFDMDGLLIDSEDLYTEVTNRILNKYGRPNLPWDIKAQLQGRPGPAANEIFHQWAQLPISQSDCATQLAALQQSLFPSTKPLPGVLTLLNTLRDTYHLDLAIATSSHARNYALKTTHLPELFDTFFGTPNPTKPSEHKFPKIVGDDPRIPAGRGKPRGDIYLLALDMINEDRAKRRLKGDVKPEECLVFEDSVPGVEAGRRAGMRVCWCPHPGLKETVRGTEEKVLAGRTGDSGLGEEAEEAKERGLKGWPSVLGDGWAGEVGTLEEFPYVRFGIGGGEV